MATDVWQQAVQAIADDDIDSLRACLDHELQPNVWPEGQISLLRYACEHRRADALQLLIERGAEVDAKSRSGWTALHHAVDADTDAASQRHELSVEWRVTSVLLAHGARDDLVDDRGKTAAEMAATSGTDWHESYLALKASVTES